MALRTHGISKSFGGNPVLQDIHLSFEAGRIHALLGENGAGKSTLMKILSGIYQPDAGHLEWQDERVEFKDPAAAQEAGISLIPQELNLALHLSVSENVFLGRETSCWGFLRAEEARRKTEELIREYQLDFSAQAQVKSLSPSQRQQVEILRALIRARKVLILDEPTAYFSDRESEKLYRMMNQLRSQGVALIFITHRLEELEGLADWVSVLRDGICVFSSAMSETSLPQILSQMVGGDIEQIFPEKMGTAGKPILRLQNISLPGRLQDVSFEVRRGEILGLGGFVGSRRTAVAEVLFGLHPAYSGDIYLEDQPVHLKSPEQALELGLAFVTEDRKLTGIFPHLSVLENVGILSLRTFESHLWISEKAETEACTRVIEQLKVRYRSLGQLSAQLSGGNQQKCVLARWLMTRPRLLVLDEPTRGIDMGARVELYRWFHRLAAQGMGILLISSDLRELEGLCNRIAVFREGHLVQTLQGEAASRHEIVRHAALGS
ncbi:MAG: sugar ABC transporter ATP-binding protein [Acidobacteriota bacterium]